MHLNLLSYIQYAPEYDGGLLWNDPDVGIEWPLDGIDEIPWVALTNLPCVNLVWKCIPLSTPFLDFDSLRGDIDERSIKRKSYNKRKL